MPLGTFSIFIPLFILVYEEDFHFQARFGKIEVLASLIQRDSSLFGQKIVNVVFLQTQKKICSIFPMQFYFSLKTKKKHLNHIFFHFYKGRKGDFILVQNHPALEQATLTDTPLPLSGVVELLPQDQEVDDIGHVVVSAIGPGTFT